MVPSLERPDMAIIPDPCDEAATNRNWDAVRRILVQVTNILNERAGTLMASVTLIHDPNECTPAIVFVDGGTFTPFILADPVNPIIPPTDVDNPLNFAVYPDIPALLAFNPNDNPPVGRWKIVNVYHETYQVLTDFAYTGSALEWHFQVVNSPVCSSVGTDDIPLETGRAIYQLDLSRTNGCSLTSQQMTIQGFATALDPATYEEAVFDSVQVLTDVYQSTPYGNILGYYYRLWVPCVDLVGEDLLIYVDRCLTSGSGTA